MFNAYEISNKAIEKAKTEHAICFTNEHESRILIQSLVEVLEKPLNKMAEALAEQKVKANFEAEKWGFIKELTDL